MALSVRKRRKIIDELITNEVFNEDSEDYLSNLTDNQLIAISQPEDLDEMVTFVANAEEESEDDDGEDDSADDDRSEGEQIGDDESVEDAPTDNVSKMSKMSEMSDEELKAELRARQLKKTPKSNKRSKKKKKGSYPTPPTSNAEDGSEMTVEQWLEASGAPKAVVSMVNNAQAIENAEREDYIEIITANDANMFTEEQLEGSTTETLKGLAHLAARSQSRSPQTNFAGRGGRGGLVGNRQVETPLGVPDLWAEPDSQ